VSASLETRRPVLLSPLWLQGIVLTFVAGVAILAYLALRIDQDHRPSRDTSPPKRARHSSRGGVSIGRSPNSMRQKPACFTSGRRW
jgi:hypothetical protein